MQYSLMLCIVILFHCTVVDIVMMYYAIVVSTVNNVSIVDK